MARRVHTSTALQDRCKIAARCRVLRREQGLALGVRTATGTSRTLGRTSGPALASAVSAVGSALSLASASTRCAVPTAKLQEDLGVETRSKRVVVRSTKWI